MFFKSKKEQYFLTLEDTPSSEPPKAPEASVSAPEVAPPAPAEPVKAPEAPKPVPAQSVPAVVEPVAAPIVATPVAPTPAPAAEPVYAFFPARRRPGPSLQGFMTMARSLGRS